MDRLWIWAADNKPTVLIMCICLVAGLVAGTVESCTRKPEAPYELRISDHDGITIVVPQ